MGIWPALADLDQLGYRVRDPPKGSHLPGHDQDLPQISVIA